MITKNKDNKHVLFATMDKLTNPPILVLLTLLLT